MTSIFKRDGRKGFALQYRDPGTGKSRQKQFPTKRAAEEFEDDLRAKERAAAGLAKDERFSDYAARWLHGTKTAVRSSTATGYDSALKHQILPTFGTMMVRDITKLAVKNWVVDRRLKLSKKYVSNLKGVLHAIMESAVDDGIVSSNPAAYRGKSKLLKLTPTRGEKRRKIRALDAQQLPLFFAAAKESKRYVLFYLAFMTGLRPGECLGLQPGDLNFRKHEIHVERAWTKEGKLEPTKTDEVRDVDMSPGLELLLRQHLDSRPESEWLFPAADGGRLDHFTLLRDFRRILKHAGITAPFSPHSLRHTFATQLLLGGESIYYVQKQLGHADIRMTVDHYGSHLPAGDRRCVERLEQRLHVSPVSEVRPDGTDSIPE